MKKVFLTLGVILIGVSASMAQDKKTTSSVSAGSGKGKTVDATKMVKAVPGPDGKMPTTTMAPEPGKPTTLKPENLAFQSEIHDFGTLLEGPAADYEFTFKNTGKEPIIIQQVHASCGCTTPSYSKDPVLPGKTGSVKASYNTAGRVAPFTKTITVTSNAGTKVLTIKGTVEKAPDSSVPQNSSMMKTN